MVVHGFTHCLQLLEPIHPGWDVGKGHPRVLLVTPPRHSIIDRVRNLSTADFLEDSHAVRHNLSVGPLFDPLGVRAAIEEGQDRLAKVGVPVQDKVRSFFVVKAREPHEIGLLPEHMTERQDALVQQARAESLDGLLLWGREWWIEFNHVRLEDRQWKCANWYVAIHAVVSGRNNDDL
jgi:hypothetical protein